MGRAEYLKFLNEVAKPGVPFGIYAVEKDGQAHMVIDKCESITQLKKKAQEYRKQGYKVHSNGR